MNNGIQHLGITVWALGHRQEQQKGSREFAVACALREAQYGDCSTTLFVQMRAPKTHSEEGKLQDMNWCQDKWLAIPQRGKIDEVKRNPSQCLFLDIFIAGQKADVKSTESVDASCMSASRPQHFNCSPHYCPLNHRAHQGEGMLPLGQGK